MFNFRSVFSNGAQLAPSEKQMNITEKLKRFSADESGIATVWSMFWLIICFSISGLAIDVTNAWKVNQILQTTADVSALAGAIELQTVNNSAIEAIVEVEANDFAARNMKPTRYGDVLRNPDIIVGFWDADARTFDPMVDLNDPRGLANAVQTITRQTGANGTSAVGTFFLRFVGFERFTVWTTATAKVFTAKCDYDGIISEGEVKLSTGQEFYDEYCVHGELGLDISRDNYFDDGTTASVADLDTCGPSTGHCVDEANPGIEDALEERSLRYSKASKIGDYLQILFEYENLVDDVINGPVYNYVGSLLDAGRPVGADPAVLRNTITVNNRNPFDISMLVPGQINELSCPRDGYDVNLSTNGVGDGEIVDLANMVIIGDGCDFTFDSATKYSDAIIATNATGTQTISGASGVVLGLEEDPVCSQGGEVTLITAGSVGFTAKLSAYDLEVIAADDVHLAAHANETSIHIGTSISAGGDVQVTTGHTFVGCAGKTVSVFDAVRSWALVL